MQNTSATEVSLSADPPRHHPSDLRERRLDHLEETVIVVLRIQSSLVRCGLRSLLTPHHDMSMRDDAADPPLDTGWVKPRSVVTVTDEASLKFVSDKPSCVLVAPDSPGDMLLSAVKQGVRTIVAESAVEGDLVHAVRAAAAGVAYVSGAPARYLLDCLAHRLPQQTSAVRKALDRLSRRERQILQLLGNAESNSGIARALKISEATVRSHVYHILTKLDLETRTEAVLFGHEFALAAADGSTLT